MVFSRPGYQNSVAGVTGAGRGVPDISMSGACNGAVDMYQSFGGQRRAGTRPAAPAGPPLFAGVVALADQVAGHPLRPDQPGAVQDVRHGQGRGHRRRDRGNNTVSFPQGGKLRTVTGFRALPGYDLASGVGTVNAARFVPELAKLAG